MSRLFLLTIIYFITATFALAQQRPLFTDDVDITSPGSIELSVGVDFLQNAKFPLSGLKGDLTKVGDIRLRTGLANNVEIQIEGTVQNFLAINSQSASNVPLRITGNSTNDFDDFTFSTKIKLANEGRFRPAIGFKFGFQMPNTDQSRGIGTNQINIFGKMILQKSFGKRFTGGRRASIYGNLGLAIMSAPLQNFTQNDLLLYGLAGNFRLNKRISIVSEINGRLNTRSGPAPIGTESIGQFRIGAQIRASGLRFDTAAALGLTKYSPRSGIIFGVTYQSPTFIPLAQ